MPKVYIKGKGQVDLNNNDFLAEGGQGKIFAKGNVVYKLYHEPSKMIPSAKIDELSVLTDTNIIKPEDLLINSKNQPIGYTMKFVPDTNPLCKIFTKAFKQREGVKEDQIIKLVRRMQETLSHIHDKNILAVDLNEMNFLVSKVFDEVYFIDVDSYQTKNFPATVLMESIRDRHMKPGHFTKETDWFSFAIVTFQMFIGIHPYKGKHPTIQNLEERMKKNISVLNPTVSIPVICYPITNIPKSYLEWYKALFENGLRVSPPQDLTNNFVINTIVKKISNSNNFDMEEIHKFNDNIIDYYHSNGVEIIVTEKHVYVNGRKDVLNVKKPVFGFTQKMNRPIVAFSKDGLVNIYDVLQQKTLHTCVGKNYMEYDGRIYVQGEQNIYEVNLIEGKDTFVSTQSVSNILEKATQMFDGVVVQNLLGSYYVSIFPKPNHHNQINIKELNRYKIIDAKYKNNVLMIVGNKNGKYDRLVFRFNENWEYDCRITKDVCYNGINFVVLDNGICICINEEEKVEIFNNKKDSATLTEIDDPAIHGDMKLFNKGTKVLFAENNKISSMTMRKK